MKATITSDFAALIDESHPNYKTRYLVFYGGRASGKSVSVARGLLIRGMKNKEFILCTREYQNSISDSVIKTLANEIDNLGLTNFYEVQSNKIIGKNGTEFIFKGIKNNVQSIKSIPDISLVWVEEAQTVSHNSYEVLIPTIRKNDSQIIITFNPIHPSDPTYERFVKVTDPSIHLVKVNYNRNPWLPDTIQEEIEYMRRHDPEAFEHIYLGNFDNRRNGCVYAKQLQQARDDGRITRVPYDPSYEVFTAWDLGWGDATAIWFCQFAGRELRWIDYYENSGEQLDHYVKFIKEKPYNYDMHYLPHDGSHGNIRGLNVSQQLWDMGLNNIVLEIAKIETGIDELRRTLAFSVFDENKCADGLHCLEHYAYDWDEDRQIFKKSPKKDWSSHGADAARYVAMAVAHMKGSLLEENVDPYSRYRGNKSWMG